jgi:hypothetical protein
MRRPVPQTGTGWPSRLGGLGKRGPAMLAGPEPQPRCEGVRYPATAPGRRAPGAKGLKELMLPTRSAFEGMQ